MATLLSGKTKDLGSVQVTRMLPHAKKRMVGPFIFFDYMAPAELPAGVGIDVRPHPHIGLATVTYLFAGNMLHRDSLGNVCEIAPGDVNWMTAGKGIVHSERATIESIASVQKVHGIQCWVALPKDSAEIEPDFCHVDKQAMPHFLHKGVTARLIAGEAYDMSSPVKTYSPMFYLDIFLQADSGIDRPEPTQECAVFVVSGSVIIGDHTYSKGDLILLDDEHHIQSAEGARVMLLGGEEWSEVPHIYWNFVSFSRERLEQAKADWQAQRFPVIAGDNREFIPLPDK